MDAERKQELRHAAAQFLYERSLLAFAPGAVARLLYRRGLVDFAVTEEDAREALEFLRGLGLVEGIQDKLGGGVSYKITAAGVLAHERGEA